MATFAPVPMTVPPLEQLKAILASVNNNAPGVTTGYYNNEMAFPFQQQNAVFYNASNNVGSIAADQVLPPQNKVSVSGLGRSWVFEVNSSVEQILRTVRGDVGSCSRRLVLEALRDGLPPVKYNYGAKVPAVAEGWRLAVRCIELEPKPYVNVGARIGMLLDRDCRVCGEGPRTKALLPCNHMMCEECAVQMSKIQKKCPICHQWIKSCKVVDIAEPYQPDMDEDEEKQRERERAKRIKR